MAQITWFKKSQGLATRFDPSRIIYDSKMGISHLAEAYNVDFDFTGAIFRRKGYEESNISGDCHSFFWDGGVCSLVKDTGLFLLGEDMSVTQIRSGLTSGRRMSYCQVGDAILYMNGEQSGVIRNSENFAYIMPPKTYYPDQTKVYNNPPVGHIIKYFAGRTWIAVGSNLFFSEPFGPNLFRLSTNFIPFPARITMIAPVLNGLFVSTVNRIYFFNGTSPDKFVQMVIAQYSAIEGTDVQVDGIAVAGGKISSKAMQMFTTTKGICLGTPEGELINFTYETLEYPVANIGCAVYTGDKYIVCLGDGADKLTICVSLNLLAPSQYAGFNFKGMCKFQDKIVGGNENGAYTLLTGNADGSEAIRAFFRTGPTAFGMENEKRLRRLFFTLRSNGVMKFEIFPDDRIQSIREFKPVNEDLGIIHQQLPGGRDIRGKHLDMKVSNVNGSDFTVSEIQALLIVKGPQTEEVT